MSRFVPARRVGAALAVVSLIAPAAPVAAEPGPVSYVPPLDAPVVDGFRPPATQFSAGNRGIDYAAAEGDPVRAAAPGRVVFAGRIGSQFHVTVLHDDGIRTSYSFLRDVAVHRGDRVEQGQVVGTAAGRVHFGARAGEAYLDPTDLFAGDLPAIRLVPIEELPPEDEERGLLRRALSGIRSGVAAVPGWIGEQAGAVADQVRDDLMESIRRTIHYVETLVPGLSGVGVMTEAAAAAAEWEETRHTCTPPGVEPPPPTGRRIAVLVGGLGSSSAALREGKGVGGVDTHALGFAARDTYYFSYQGGHVGQRGYGPEDTQNGFEESGAKLAAFLSHLHRENPGVPIVLIAHSQGGLVSRAAIACGGAGPAAVSDLITLATPHHGSDVATGLGEVRGHLAAQVPVDVAGRALAGVDPGSESVQQLSETSEFIRDQPPVPDRIRFTSIAGTGDPVVAAPRARVEGADNRLVSAGTQFGDHDALPGHANARREMALALAGMAATCQARAEFVWNHVRAYLNGLSVDAASAAVSLVLSSRGL
ncbi:MAG TPA: peptidoglycan DD-metalloendopeptidase family protein [Acidimicrobiales bacterium]|nr:peptidoglycan DD-metalloendopeptidase family protein [Acidimicrobiales bacterium]